MLDIDMLTHIDSCKVKITTRHTLSGYGVMVSLGYLKNKASNITFRHMRCTMQRNGQSVDEFEVDAVASSSNSSNSWQGHLTYYYFLYNFCNYYLKILVLNNINSAALLSPPQN